MYAAGKIPGGYIKREGRPSEHGVLSARQIDRPIRPLFPDGFRNDVQIVTTVLSIDPELDADVLAVCAAGAALAVSDIPFDKNVAAVRVGRDEDGKYIINPTLPQYETGGMDIVVAGTADARDDGRRRRPRDHRGRVPRRGRVRARRDQEDRHRDRPARQRKPARRSASSRCSSSTPTLEAWVRKNVQERRRQGDAHRREGRAQRGVREVLSVEAALDKLSGKKDDDVREMLEEPATQRLREDHQVDGRGRAARHGRRREDSSRRPQGRRDPPDLVQGRTTCRASTAPASSRAVRRKCFTAATLGSIERRAAPRRHHGDHEQALHALLQLPAVSRSARRARCAAPAAAKSATATSPNARCVPVLPPQDEFPYTMRLISEVLESNGSSSMASVCGSTLALMDAGVPIQRPRRRRRDGPDPQGRRSTRSSPTSRASKTRSARWTSRSRAPTTASPRSRWTSRSQGITIDIMREAMDAGEESRACSSSASSRKRSPSRATEMSAVRAAHDRRDDQPRQDQGRHRTRRQGDQQDHRRHRRREDRHRERRHVYISAPDGASRREGQSDGRSVDQVGASRRDLPRHGHAA